MCIRDRQLAAAAGIPGANVVTVTLGSQLSGELAQFAAVELGEDTSEAAPEAAEAETTACLLYTSRCV